MISFSGGRTSGYMLRRILDAHGGTLPGDVNVLFADTGKERPQTLAFVAEVSERWSVPIATVKRAAPEGVTPFDQLIRDKSFLPNPVMRFCTYELKVKVMQAHMRERHGDDYAEVIGFRADERGRRRAVRGALAVLIGWNADQIIAPSASAPTAAPAITAPCTTGCTPSAVAAAIWLSVT